MGDRIVRDAESRQLSVDPDLKYQQSGVKWTGSLDLFRNGRAGRLHQKSEVVIDIASEGENRLPSACGLEHFNTGAIGIQINCAHRRIAIVVRAESVSTRCNLKVAVLLRDGNERIERGRIG